MSDAIDLGLGLLDHQLVDSEGRRCGKIDDLEVTGIQEGQPRVEAMLVGRRRAVHVPWEDVEEVDSGVHLKRTAQELRLGRADRRASRLVAWIPGAK